MNAVSVSERPTGEPLHVIELKACLKKIHMQSAGSISCQQSFWLNGHMKRCGGFLLSHVSSAGSNSPSRRSHHLWACLHLGTCQLLVHAHPHPHLPQQIPILPHPSPSQHPSTTRRACGQVHGPRLAGMHPSHLASLLHMGLRAAAGKVGDQQVEMQRQRWPAWALQAPSAGSLASWQS